MGGKQRIMALYQTQPDRSLRAKALAKEYGIGGHSHDFLDGSRGFVNHDRKGLEFDHYPEHKKFTLSWTQVEKYINLMVQSDRYLTDKEKEHYTPPASISAKPDVELARAKNLIREFCQEEYDSEPDFSDLSKIGVAYTHATDEDIPIQVNVDLVGYRVERYLGDILVDERQYESLEDLTETELEALDFSELVSVTDEELEHYHNKADERPALLPLDAATEYNALKEQHPDALVGFEQSGQFEFYGEDARKVCELVGGKLLEKETALGTDPLGNIIRLDNSLNNFPERINSAENELATLHQQQAAAQIEVEKPFPQEEELAEKSARLAELNAQLDVDEKNHEPEQEEEEQEDAPRRPSVLAALEEKSDKPEPVKPFRSYYDKDGDAR